VKTNGQRPGATPVVAIVGAGFAGLGLAMRLARAGIRTFTIFERAASIGGTWRENTYPGAACDIPSHLYSFSFEQNPDWERTYAGQAEILRYLEFCAAKYALYEHIRFGSDVRAARFDERRNRWTLELADGTTFDAAVLVTACGVLNKPQLPNLPGLETFAGPAFHSAQWRHDVDLNGKRVGVIGTGASAVQIVPEIAPRVASLTLFQRSAPYVIPKPDRPYGARERKLYRKLPFLLRASRALTYAVHEVRFVAFGYVRAAIEPSRRIFEKMLERQVPDPELRRKLTPDYQMGCKRVMISNDYFSALARENVEVVTDRVERVTPNGVVTADGRERAFDVLVYATGFAATGFLVPMRVAGRNGTLLQDVWRDGAEAYLGVSVAGFPNFFMLYGPNTNLGHLHARSADRARVGRDRNARARRARDARSERPRPGGIQRAVAAEDAPQRMGRRVHELVRRRGRQEYGQLARLHVRLPAPSGQVAAERIYGVRCLALAFRNGSTRRFARSLRRRCALE
jgi:cation diffusion facilitator CzcD-associated flavoprotein CzcO